MVLRDLRHALRIFGREPGFAATVVLTLALGMGANTALFAVVEAVLLRPLPYPAADQLVLVKHRDTRTGLAKHDLVLDDFVDLRARQQSFETLAGYYGHQSVLTREGEPVRSRASPSRRPPSACWVCSRRWGAYSRLPTRARTPRPWRS